MRTYKLTAAYDGSRYQGWQRQENTDCTIEGVIERTAEVVIGYPVDIHGSGRTDRGVHAKGQTASMILRGKIDSRQFQAEMNRRLPEDIRIVGTELVKNGFHARLHAVGKTYEYLIDTREKPDVFMRRYTYHYPGKLDIAAMREAASYLTGKHDFAAFTDKKDEKSTIRTIYAIIIEEQNEKLRIEFRGTGFMYHMVRILTGTLLETGDGRRRPEEISKLLLSGRRTDAGFLAPSRGLCLKEVHYGRMPVQNRR